MDKDKIISELIKNTKVEFTKWLNEMNISIYTSHFIAFDNFNLEIYVFYTNENEVQENKNNGISNLIREFLLQTLEKFKYPKQFLDRIVFIFDSNENVMKNYEGSYFFRLR